MKWKVVRDLRFHNNEKREFFFIKEGSVYEEVPQNNQSDLIKRCYISSKKQSKKNNVQFVVLEAEGKQRVFEVGDAVPHKQRRIRRIKRWTNL